VLGNFRDIFLKLLNMPYTKSGIFYTAKPTNSGSVSSRMKASYGGGYKGGPRYQPGYYRGVAQGKQTFVLRTPGGKGATETKYFDAQRTSTVISEGTDWTGSEVDPGTLMTLVCPTQGAQINQRIGRKISLKKLRIRGVITPTVRSDQADVLPPAAYRIIVFQDMQTNGAQAQGEDVMKTPLSATTQAAFSSFMSLANLGRFKILKDKIYREGNAVAFNDAAATGSVINGGQIPFKINLAFKKPIVIHFNSSNGGAGDGDVGDVVDNSFHILALRSVTDAGAASIQYASRAVYSDV